MFAGHVGVGLALGRLERRVNVGVLIGAALLLDGLLWPLVLLGWESVVIPPDFSNSHQLQFAFPYSHGLTAALLWSLLAALLAWFALPPLNAFRRRGAAVVAAAVFSHWLLDVLVHRPEMPLAGLASPVVGLSLWDDMPRALALEAAITLAGLWLYIVRSGLAPRRAVALAALTLVVLAFTVAGMTFAPAPPSVPALASSSWITLVIVCALAFWIARSGQRAGRDAMR